MELNTNFWIWLMITCIFDSVLGSTSLIKVLVELPARKKMGDIEFAHYGRAADLGNGRIIYPLLGIGGALLTIITWIDGVIINLPNIVIVPFYLAAALSIIHSLTTVRAAPNMIKIGTIEDNDELLKTYLDRFIYWNKWRALVQFTTFLVLLWGISVYAYTL
jgi:hypothetical protein